MLALIGVFIVLGLLGLAFPHLFYSASISQVLFSFWLSAFQLILLVTVIGGFYGVLRKRMFVRLFWELFYFVLSVCGVWYLVFFFFPGSSIAFFVSLFITLLVFLFPRVIFANLFYFVGALGAALLISVPLGLYSDLLLFCGLAIYDWRVTHEHGPLGSLRGYFFSKQLFPGFLFPAQTREWVVPLSELPAITPYLTIAEMTVFASVFIWLGTNAWAIGLIALGVSLLTTALALSSRKLHYPRSLIPWFAFGVTLPIVLFRLLGRL